MDSLTTLTPLTLILTLVIVGTLTVGVFLVRATIAWGNKTASQK
ncbi:hypothetical protein [Oculatella sp. LEGE 06141]|nr:hypothetical protein [Oculatella sp. LEGE 06141]